jgi:pyruvate dehydrogenase E2 component (dihydrolipoamide acetyltransferase)
MPQMGVSVSEGTVTKWLKQVGEHIESDETLLEISTDKVDTEVPSPGSGVVTEILVNEGETVDVGTILARISPEGAAPPVAEPAPPEPAPEAAPEVTAEAPPAEVAPPVQAAPAVATERAAESSSNGRTFVSPVVARIAGEHGIDPSRVPGTGIGGRVTKKDILSCVESGGAAPEPEPAAEVPAAAAPVVETPPAVVEPPAAPAPAAPAPPAPVAAAKPAPAPVAAAAAAEPEAGETFEPMSAMRRGIAEHMRHSLDTSTHVTSAIEVDMTKVAQIRERLKKEYQSAYGVNPTYLAFIARATVETLRDHPYVNGEIRGDRIVTKNFVNLGFAVELADGKGLIVPVVKNAETLNLLGMAKGIADIAARARSKQLTPDDVTGGSFTITNPGGYGTFHGTPIISQPQVGILGTYAIVKRPWVITDESGSDAIAIRSMMNLTLTYDHRLVDGAYAGRFLRDLRERLQTWGENDY